MQVQYYTLVSGTLTKMGVTKGSGPGILPAWFSVLNKYENFLLVQDLDSDGVQLAPVRQSSTAAGLSERFSIYTHGHLE